MEGVVKGRIGCKENNGIDNRCCYKKGNGCVIGNFFFQKMIDNGDDFIFIRREKYFDKGFKKDFFLMILREKMINFFRCDINFNQF